jgi:hypothetical protein
VALCGRPADPRFEEPWALEALSHRLRHDLLSTDKYRRALAEIDQHVWGYRDARLRATTHRSVRRVAGIPSSQERAKPKCHTDVSLARLLLTRARCSDSITQQQTADVREAVSLGRRRCRLWRFPSIDDCVLRREALADCNVMDGHRASLQQQRAWRRLVEARWSYAKRATDPVLSGFPERIQANSRVLCQP